MKYSKKIIALILILTMIIPLCACSKKGTDYFADGICFGTSKKAVEKYCRVNTAYMTEMAEGLGLNTNFLHLESHCFGKFVGRDGIVIFGFSKNKVNEMDFTYYGDNQAAFLSDAENKLTEMFGKPDSITGNLFWSGDGWYATLRHESGNYVSNGWTSIIISSTRKYPPAIKTDKHENAS